jgi:uncharacterized heparinase superfamily protein
VHGVPQAAVRKLIETDFYRRNLRMLAHQMRRVRTIARAKSRVVDYFRRRPNLGHMFWADGNRAENPADVIIQPNFDNSPFSQPA